MLAVDWGNPAPGDAERRKLVELNGDPGRSRSAIRPTDRYRGGWTQERLAQKEGKASRGCNIGCVLDVFSLSLQMPPRW